MQQTACSSLTVAELAELCQATIEGDPRQTIHSCADLSSATAEQVSFFSGSALGMTGERYRKDFEASQAAAILVHPDTARVEGKTYLLCSDPSLAFQTAVEHFAKQNIPRSGFDGVHTSAVIHPSVVIGADVSIGPNAVVDQGVTIGDCCSIGAGVCIGPGVVMGDHCLIHPNVTIREGCRIGSRVILQPGVVIGGCGFGYHTTARGEHEKLQQLGIVVLEDDVEIGANSTIDRARFTETRIGRGTKIDNLVMIAHGCRIGPHNLIVSQAGIAGSTKTGSHVVIAAQAGLVGHLDIGNQVMIGAQSGVTKSLPTGNYQGAPAVPLKEFQKQFVEQRRLPRKLKALEDRVKVLEERE